MRSWRHKMLHLPSGAAAPPMPVCDYEPDEPELAAPKKTRSAPVPGASGSSTGSGGGSGKKKSKEGELENRIQMLEDMLKLAVGAGVSNLGTGDLQQVVNGTPSPQQPFLRPDDILLSAPPAMAPLPSPSFQQAPSDSFLQPPFVASPVQIWSYESPDSATQSTSAASGSSRSLPSGSMPAAYDFISPESGEGAKLTPDSMNSPDDYLTELLWPGFVCRPPRSTEA